MLTFQGYLVRSVLLVTLAVLDFLVSQEQKDHLDREEIKEIAVFQELRAFLGKRSDLEIQPIFHLAC